MTNHTRLKNSAANCDPLSASTVAVLPYLKTQCGVNASKMLLSVIDFSGIAYVRCVNLSFTSRRKRFAAAVLGRGPKMSIATESNEFLARNDRVRTCS